MSKVSRIRKVVKWGAAVGLAVGVGVYCYEWRTAEVYTVSEVTQKLVTNYPDKAPLPSRQDLLKRLQTEEFDVLIIGGGASGVMTALDAQTRGLKTALVELEDFAAGTSSCSTKLVHGGMRYLEKAIFNLDREQYEMVKESLHERFNFLQTAPHLSEPLPIMIPIYDYFNMVKMMAGGKMYDMLSFGNRLHGSYWLPKDRVQRVFPQLCAAGLKGGVVIYDGQQNDARTCLSAAITAIRYGATVLNHCEVTELLKSRKDVCSELQISGVTVTDRISSEKFKVKAKCVVNCTGPYSDRMRLLDDPKAREIVKPSQGVHITLPSYYSPDGMGLLDTSSDGRVIFLLPWLNYTIVGTTDQECTVEEGHIPTEAQVQFIQKEVQRYIGEGLKVRRGDVLAAWSGLRPLVKDPNSADTQSLARNHIIEVSKSGLVTLAGGKWTTCRRMAQDTVDRVIDEFKFNVVNQTAATNGLLLEGAHKWSPTLFMHLVQRFGLNEDVAKHLARTYGDKAIKIAKQAELTGYKYPIVGKRLHPDHPFIEAEVGYALNEYCLTAVDFLARRTRLAFLDAITAAEVLPRVVQLMGDQLGWDEKKRSQEKGDADRYLRTNMGLDLKAEVEKSGLAGFRPSLTPDQERTFMTLFKKLDTDSKGYISTNDLKKRLNSHGQQVREQTLKEILAEVDVNKNGVIEPEEFLQLMAALSSGVITSNRFAAVADLQPSNFGFGPPPDRSGGGL